MPNRAAFLPGTNLQILWDSTSLGWLKECARKYQYQMIEGWRSRGTTSAHLIFGQIYHSALELYDRIKADQTPTIICPDCSGAGGDNNTFTCSTCSGRGMVVEPWDHDEAVKAVILHILQKAHDWHSDHPAKNRETLLRSVVWYLEEFKDDSCQTVVLKSGKPAVELTFKFDSGIEIGATNLLPADAPSTTYWLTGHLDRLATFQSDTYVMDRKTTAGQLGPQFFSGFNPHSQMSLYTIAGEIVFGTPIKGVIIDGAQILVGSTRFARGFSHRTKAQSDEYLSDLAVWLRHAEGYAAAGHWPKNEMSCHNYGGCPFRKICSIDPRVRQTFLESDFERSFWEPGAERG